MTYTFFSGLWAERYLIAGVLAAVLSIIAFAPYIRDILRGTTRPDRACWLIWTVLASISGASNLYEGAGASMAFVGTQVAGTLVVFVLSIRMGSGHMLSRSNVVILAVAAVGLVTWAMTETAAYALALSIGVSALGVLATMLKAYRAPTTETMGTWGVMLVAAALGVYSVATPDLLLLAYPVYLLVLYVCILGAQWMGRIAHNAQAERAAMAARRMTVPPLRAPSSTPVFVRAEGPAHQMTHHANAQVAA